MDKRLIRSHYIALRSKQKPYDISNNSHKICEKVLNDPLFTESDRILIYAYYNKEVNTWPIAKVGMAFCKKMYVPVVNGNDMLACRITSLDFEKDFLKDRFGIYEPRDMSECIPAQKLDLVIAPMVAADTKKYRLGYGGGFYDRFLQHTSIPIIGVCFDFQLLKPPEFLPHEPHDIKMTKIYTELNDIE